MTTGDGGDRAAQAARRQHCARITRYQHAQQAEGRCRCGDRIAPGSRSRCLACLERRRLEARRQRRIPTPGRAGRKRRGRPLIGSLAARWQALAADLARQERDLERQAYRRAPAGSLWPRIRTEDQTWRVSR